MPVYNRLPQAGGNASETALWVNPSPTATMAARTITLSQAATNFKYLKIVYAYQITDQTLTSAIYDMAEASNFVLGKSTARFALGFHTAASNDYGRFGSFTNEDYLSIAFTTSYRADTTATTANNCIPVAIYGVN